MEKQTFEELVEQDSHKNGPSLLDLLTDVKIGVLGSPMARRVIRVSLSCFQGYEKSPSWLEVFGDEDLENNSLAPWAIAVSMNHTSTGWRSVNGTWVQQPREYARHFKFRLPPQNPVRLTCVTTMEGENRKSSCLITRGETLDSHTGTSIRWSNVSWSPDPPLIRMEEHKPCPMLTLLLRAYAAPTEDMFRTLLSTIPEWGELSSTEQSALVEESRPHLMEMLGCDETTAGMHLEMVGETVAKLRKPRAHV
jgi:hypothetical protein